MKKKNIKKKKINRSFVSPVEVPPEEFIPFMDNPFVDGYSHGKFQYSKDFDVAMYKQIQEGKSYVEAYNALGFDTDILGTDRANSAGKRVMEKAREHKLFTIDETSYDGSVPREDMGNLTAEEEHAYLKARTHYLEELIKGQKKILSVLEKKNI